MNRSLAGWMALALVGAALVLPGQGQAREQPSAWVASWAASPTSGIAPPPSQPSPPRDPALDAALTAAIRAQVYAPPTPPPSAKAAAGSGETLRQIVRLSAGGKRLRLRISNTYGTEALTVGAAQVATPAEGGAVVPGTGRTVTFGGSPTALVAPGGSVLSDPVEFEAAPLRQLAVSLYFPRGGQASAVHPLYRTHSYAATGGDRTGDPAFASATPYSGMLYLTGVEVEGGASAAIVALGDSITDGTGSWGPERGWPDVLAARLRGAGRDIAVVNAGIDGNRVNGGGGRSGEAALARLDRDVLAQPGVRYLIVLEGINDIGLLPRPNPPPANQQTAADIIFGLKQIVARGRAHGLKVFVGTLLPEGTWPFFTPDREARRAAVNDWIRNSGEHDGVIDFAAAVADRQDPTLMRAEFRDGVHPNDAGARAMGEAVPLGLFDAPAPAPAPIAIPPFAELDCTGSRLPSAVVPAVRRPISAEARAAGAAAFARNPAGLCAFREANGRLPPATPRRVVFMGDSITAGWPLADPAFFAGDRIDRGLVGQTSLGMLLRFRQDVIALRPAVVHILAGINDIQSPAGTSLTKDNIASMAQLAKANGIQVVLGSVTPSADFWTTPGLDPGPKIVEINTWMRAFAAANGLIYADYHTALVGPGLGVKPGLSVDDMHPNAAGYAVMRPIAAAAIDRALALSGRR